MSSGRFTSVARPAQYTPDAVSSPTQSSARAKSSVAPTGISNPAPRNTRANATGARSSSTARHRGSHEDVESVRAHAVVVFVVLEDRAEGRVDHTFVEPGRTEHGQRWRPGDRPGGAGRLVELEVAQCLDRARDVTSKRVDDLGCAQPDDRQ